MDGVSMRFECFLDMLFDIRKVRKHDDFRISKISVIPFDSLPVSRDISSADIQYTVPPCTRDIVKGTFTYFGRGLEPKYEWGTDRYHTFTISSATYKRYLSIKARKSHNSLFL